MRENSGHRAAHRGNGRRYGRAGLGRGPRRHRTRGRLGVEETLTAKASRALGWNFGSTLMTKLSLFGIGVMLARLLGPHAFGTYAVAYVALIILLTINELGVSLAIVRWQGDPGEIAPTVTTISLLVSAVIYAGCFFGAPAYASAMGAPTATGVVRVLALVVLSDAFTNTPAALLQRSFRQGKKVIADQVNVWVGTGVTIALAFTGYGAMSLAIGRLVGCVAGAILLLVFAPGSLRLGFDPVKARALLRFGLPLAGANIITFGVMSVDQIVVGHVLGTVALGLYVLALNLASWPITVFSLPVRNVGTAVFSRLQHDGAVMRATFLSAVGLLCAVALPACLLIGGSAGPLISLVYGTRWLPSARPLIWLALLGAVQVFFLLAYDYLVVLARSRFLLITQLAWLLALIPALIVGARTDGIYGAGLAEAAVAGAGILPWYLRELSKRGIRLRALGSHLWLPIAGAALVGFVAVTASKFAPSDITALAASGVTAVAVVGLLIYRMRAKLALLRSLSAEPVAAPAPPLADATPMRDVRSPAGDITGELSAIWGVIDPPPTRYRDGRPGLREPHDALLAQPTHNDPTGPPPTRYRDILGYPPSRRDLSSTSPLYRRTVASQQWDPAKTTQRRQAARRSSRPVGDGHPGSTKSGVPLTGPPPTGPPPIEPSGESASGGFSVAATRRAHEETP